MKIIRYIRYRTRKAAIHTALAHFSSVTEPFHVSDNVSVPFRSKSPQTRSTPCFAEMFRMFRQIEGHPRIYENPAYRVRARLALLGRDLAPCCGFVVPGRERYGAGMTDRCQPDNGLGFQGENAPKTHRKITGNKKTENCQR